MHPSPDAPQQKSSWTAVKSAYHAFSGLLWIAPRTPSLKLGIAFGAALVGLGVLSRLSVLELALMVLLATVLLAVETLNTALEMFCDYVHPENDERIGKIKDVSAGATAFTEIGAAVMVLLVMVPHWLKLLRV